MPISTSVQVVYVDAEGKPSPIYGDPGVKPRKWVFRSSMQDNFQVETILGYAKGKGWDAIGIMHDTSGYGTASKATADKLIPAEGFKILATETYNVGDTDMTSQLQKMKAAGVKQIINFGLGPEDANLLRSAQKIDYKVQFSGAWGWSDPLVPQLAGKDLAEGVVTVASFTPDQSAAAADFHPKMLETYNEDPFPITAAQAYDATKMMLHGAVEERARTRPSCATRSRTWTASKASRRRRPSRIGAAATTRWRARTCSPRCGRTESWSRRNRRRQHGGTRDTPARAAAGHRQRAGLRQHLRADRPGLLRHVLDDRDAQLRPGRLPDDRRHARLHHLRRAGPGRCAAGRGACSWPWRSFRWCMAVMGVVVERVAVRPLRRAFSLGWILSTVGVAVILRNAAEVIWGREQKLVPSVFGDNALRIDAGLFQFGILPQESLHPGRLDG